MSPGVVATNADIKSTTQVPPDSTVSSPTTVEFTEAGDLRMSAAMATRHFPGDALVAARRGAELWLFPLTGPEGGGLLLKQRNASGDRSTLIWEALAGEHVVGERPAVWDPANAALRIALSSRDVPSPRTHR